MSLSAPDIVTLSRLLDEALDLNASQREAWLDNLSAADRHLTPKLRELLAERDNAGAQGFLSALPVLVASAPPDEAIAHAGELIGPYRLIREIGRGGMGAVWLAERADGAFKRQVALKLPRLVWAVGLAKRMAREREIGAMLEHPNIARLYDTGVDDKGRPYMAFEHIDGVAIDAWCRERRCSVRQRVQLLVQIAHALAHAHARLVVHRDLKPANVLVTADGQAHLLDFGIAKLIADNDSAADSDVTRTQGRLMTLHYASPEQVRGEPIGVATDVYGLGVLAYELLTQTKPFQTLRGTAAALEEAILAGDPALASTRVQGAPARALKGDLDAVLAKAMTLDARQRYLSIGAMAEDLQRYLDNAQVSARTPSRMQGVMKFLRRHRAGMAGAAVILAVVSVAGSQVWIQRRQTEISLAQSQTANALLQHIFSGLSPDTASTQRFSALELLDSANQFLLQRPLKSADAQRQAHWRMAELYEEIGAHDRAAAIYHDAEATARAEGSAQAVVETLLQLADVELKAGNTDQARAALARLPDAQRLGDMVRARAATLEGEALIGEGKLPEAINKLRSGQALLAASASGDALWWARSTQALGNTLRRDGQLHSAREQLLQSLGWQERREPPSLVDKLVVEGNLAAVDSWSGDFRSAAARLERVHRELRARLGMQHARSLVVATELAYALLRLGRFAESSALAREVIGALDDAAQRRWVSEFMELVLARIAMYEGRGDEAVASMRQRLARSVEEEGPTGAMTDPVRRLLGESLLRHGQTAAAEQVLRETEANQVKDGGDGHPSVATTRTLLAIAAARRGEVAQAHALWAASRQILSDRYGASHPFALAAQAYAALSAPGMPRAERAAIASRLQASTGWQTETTELVRWLNQEQPAVDWKHLPVVL